MKRTISIKLLTAPEQNQALEALQAVFAKACNAAMLYASKNKCANRVALHHLCYYDLREKFPQLGSPKWPVTPSMLL